MDKDMWEQFGQFFTKVMDYQHHEEKMAELDEAIAEANKKEQEFYRRMVENEIEWGGVAVLHNAYLSAFRTHQLVCKEIYSRFRTVYHRAKGKFSWWEKVVEPELAAIDEMVAEIDKTYSYLKEELDKVHKALEHGWPPGKDHLRERAQEGKDAVKPIN